MTVAAEGPWSKEQVASFVADTKSRLGAGWGYLVPEIQVAVIRSAALKTIRGEVSYKKQGAPLEDIDWLVRAMLTQAGLSSI